MSSLTMRRSIDDYPFTADDLPEGADDAMLVSWAVAICDDYDDTRTTGGADRRRGRPGGRGSGRPFQPRSSPPPAGGVA